MDIEWRYTADAVYWRELAELYRIAPLGKKLPERLEIAFTNSLFKCFLFDNRKLVGAGRALADGVDCSYLCDVAVHPDYQDSGMGASIVNKLVELSRGHSKILLYTDPDTEEFYNSLGFKRMNAAMGIFVSEDKAIAEGILDK